MNTKPVQSNCPSLAEHAINEELQTLIDTEQYAMAAERLALVIATDHANHQLNLVNNSLNHLVKH